MKRIGLNKNHFETVQKNIFSRIIIKILKTNTIYYLENN